MSISYLLVLLGVLTLGVAVWALFWAVDHGQYDDVEKYGASILEDENGDIPIFRPPAPERPTASREK